eukprot:11169844-Lingulodinium_polyedra.AAC.1
MSIACSSGGRNVAHITQKYVENSDLDHAKCGAKQTPTLVKSDAESPKAKKGALRGTPPQAFEQGWLSKPR